MKKKIFFELLLMFALASILCACGGEAEGEGTVTTPVETPAPTLEPTEDSTAKPTVEPTPEPTVEPTPEPTEEPTLEPTVEPTPEPTVTSKPAPSEVPESTESAKPITSPVDQIPEIDPVEREPSGVIGDGITGIDPDDPYYGIPGYEGPREGYAYSFTMGYFKLEEAQQQTEEAYQRAKEEGVSYWDWEGHAFAAEDDMDGKFGEWVKNNMDYVNDFCKRHGCTYEEYCKSNKIDP